MRRRAVPCTRVHAAFDVDRASPGDGVSSTPLMMGALMAVASLPVLVATMLTVALPSVAAALEVSATATAWVVGSFLVVQLLAQPFVGGLIGRVGFRRSLHGGLAVLSLGSLLAIASPTLPGLLAARAVQALGVAVILPTVHVLLVAGRGRAGRRFGLLTSVSNVMAAVGPVLGGLVVAWLGWRGVFSATLVLAGAVAVLVALVGRRVPHGCPQRSPDAGLRLHRLLADRRVAAATGMGVTDNAALTVLLVGLPFVIVGQGALSPAAAVVALTAAGAVAAPAGGWLADRAGYAFAARAGFLSAATGLLTVPAASAILGPGGTCAALALAGAGLGLEFPAVQAAPLALVRPGLRATAAGLAATGRHVGSLIGAMLASGLLLFHPAAVLPAAATGALVGAWLAGRIGGSDHMIPG